MWTEAELNTVASEDSLYISVPNADGSMHAPTRIWAVRAGDDVYVRSYNGPEGRWFNAALKAGHGRIRIGDFEKDVEFAFPEDDASLEASDEGYETKYAGSPYLAPMIDESSRAATVKLIPAE